MSLTVIDMKSKGFLSEGDEGAGEEKRQRNVPCLREKRTLSGIKTWRRSSFFVIIALYSWALLRMNRFIQAEREER